MQNARGRWERDTCPCPSTTIPTKLLYGALNSGALPSCSSLLKGALVLVPFWLLREWGTKRRLLESAVGLWLTPRVFLGVQTLRQAAMTLLLYTVHLEAGAGASHVKVTQMICAIPTFYIDSTGNAVTDLPSVMQFWVCALYRSSIAVLITCIRQCCLKDLNFLREHWLASDCQYNLPIILKPWIMHGYYKYSFFI